LECADTARADYLLTGNQRHYPRFWKKTKANRASGVHRHRSAAHDSVGGLMRRSGQSSTQTLAASFPSFISNSRLAM
jgi:hypothetical protein